MEISDFGFGAQEALNSGEAEAIVGKLGDSLHAIDLPSRVAALTARRPCGLHQSLPVESPQKRGGYAEHLSDLTHCVQRGVWVIHW